MTAIHKNKRLQSKKIRDSAKGEDCTLRIVGICNFNPNTTVLCHENGAGVAYKAHDIHSCYGCSDCHAWLDGGWFKYYQSTGIEPPYHYLVDSEFKRAMIETQSILIQKNLIQVI